MMSETLVLSVTFFPPNAIKLVSSEILPSVSPIIHHPLSLLYSSSRVPYSHLPQLSLNKWQVVSSYPQLAVSLPVWE